jgi:glycosyltransferase involved in cell wall biosynthesis
MQIRIVLSHPASCLFGEVREAIIATELVRLGHEVQIFRVDVLAGLRSETYDGAVTVTYFPADDPAAAPHAMTSAALLAALGDQAPDVLIVKGLGYDIVPAMLDRLAPGRTRIGYILGGLAADPALTRADFVLAESEAQIREVRGLLGQPLPCRRLPKHIDWATADRLHAVRQAGAAAEFDIVNVGEFEPRKNQIALCPAFGRYRVALVGTGETRGMVAAASEGHPDVRLFGALPNDATLGVIARSRLMVHASLWEGVPRAVIEALACGTPVVAHGFAIQERFEGTVAVTLVAAEEALLPAAEALLADPALLAALGAEGRAYARERHGPHRLPEAARQIIALAGLRGP